MNRKILGGIVSGEAF